MVFSTIITPTPTSKNLPMEICTRNTTLVLAERPQAVRTCAQPVPVWPLSCDKACAWMSTCGYWTTLQPGCCCIGRTFGKHSQSSPGEDASHARRHMKAMLERQTQGLSSRSFSMSRISISSSSSSSWSSSRSTESFHMASVFKRCYAGHAL